VQAGADLKGVGSADPIILAINEGSTECLKFLIKAGADPNVLDDVSWPLTLLVLHILRKWKLNWTTQYYVQISFFSRKRKSFALRFIDRKGIILTSLRKGRYNHHSKQDYNQRMLGTSYNRHLQTKHGLEANHSSIGAPKPPKPPRGRGSPILQRRAEPGHSASES
jgi:hypothetical protein